ncbi:hypothetical protein Mapa_009798 [Marchantia paleacea]|nr:hypothetical protein Mapa_009798 [Marchantia paleacea]
MKALSTDRQTTRLRFVLDSSKSDSRGKIPLTQTWTSVETEIERERERERENRLKMPDGLRNATMEPTSSSKKAPEIIVTNKAFQVAQAWVKNMTGGADSDPDEDDESTSMAAEAAYAGLRPARLGLGAKYVPHSAAAASMSMSPVERKLRAKLNAARHELSHSHAPASVSVSVSKEITSDLQGDEEEEEEDDGALAKDSKTSAFGRKLRNTSANLLMPTSKAGKRKRFGK